ncbi:MAG: prolipoprotein diacylglyceryl transferase [Alphaproteobacteria bacterium]|nr:prolipoprotein diacylglyceryl transferase [Alphaproteobacteria bacterium]
MFAFAFPPLDPILLSIGPIHVRWYALAYLAGFVLGIWLCKKLAALSPNGPSAKDYDDFLTWAVLGTVLGGRLGYVLFYQFDYYLQAPLEALQIWHGGMSFHGGMLGVIAAAYFFARSRKLRFFAFTDILACVTPIGLGLGRLANFVNGELFGRVTDVPWAVIFPRGGDLPRHPSQLYEASLEGVLLFAFMMAYVRIPQLRSKAGVLSGLFLSEYAAFRFVAEFFREPDAQLGFLLAGTTMGQLLCLPMFLAGLAIIAWAMTRKPQEVTPHD